MATGTLRGTETDFRNALMRSTSCNVFAEKYDSPQLGQDHIGIRSIKSRPAPAPKLRVTSRCRTLGLAQNAQPPSAAVGGDDDELAGEPDLDDDFGGRAVERRARDDALDFARSDVALAFGDLPGEDDVFEVEDREAVIFKLAMRLSVGNEAPTRFHAAGSASLLVDCAA